MSVIERIGTGTASIAIVGAGAIGSTVAVRLASAGLDVTLFARGARLRHLRQASLVLRQAGHEVQASPTLLETPDGRTRDIVFVAVKAQSLSAALPTILPLLHPGSLVVPLTNGLPWWYHQRHSGAPIRPVAAVDPDGHLARSMPPERLVGSVVFLRATLAEDGSVNSEGDERLVVGGIYGNDSAASEAIARVLKGAGLATRVSSDIRGDIWVKLALNLATNPLSVVTGATLHDMFHQPELLSVVTATLQETQRLATAAGGRLAADLPAMLEIGRNAGHFMTSMAQDYTAGRELELAAIADAAFELAEAHDVDMPTARAAVALARRMDRLRRAGSG